MTAISNRILAVKYEKKSKFIRKEDDFDIIIKNIIGENALNPVLQVVVMGVMVMFGITMILTIC